MTDRTLPPGVRASLQTHFDAISDAIGQPPADHAAVVRRARRARDAATAAEYDATRLLLEAQLSRLQAQAALDEVLASHELHAAPVVEDARISTSSSAEEDQDTADGIEWQVALDTADGGLEPNSARPTVERPRFLQEPEAPRTRPMFLRRNSGATTPWSRLLA